MSEAAHIDPLSKKIGFPSLAFLLGSLLLTAGCTTKNYGDDQFHLRMASHGKDVMWMPSKTDIVHRMLDAAEVTANDVIYDLGSGDGVIPIEAARRHGVRSVGIEYNPDLVALSKRNAKRANVEHLVTLKQGDIFVEDFSQATVVTLYLGENLNAKLMPKLLALKPGTRVVSNTFRIESWIPDREIKASSGETAYLWVVPAQVDGRWVLTGIPGLNRPTLEIRQKKQFFDAIFSEDGKRIGGIEEGSLRGNDLSLNFSIGGKPYKLRGTIDGSRFKGWLNDDQNLGVSGNLVQSLPKR